MKKKWKVVWIIFLLIPTLTFAGEISSGEQSVINVEDIIYEQIEELEVNEIQNMIDIVNQEYDGILPRLSIQEIITELMKGEKIFDYKAIFNKLIHYFLQEIYTNLRFASQILVIAIIIGILRNGVNSFGESTVSNIAQLVCYSTAVALCIGSFRYVYSIGAETINDMTSFMQAIFPLIITLLVSVGHFSAGALFHPLILASINIVSSLTETVILPAIFLSALFFLVNSLTENSYIKKLAGILRQFAVIFIGFTVTVFSSMTAIQGVISSSADNVLVKTAKFSVDKFIPIIGGYVSDSIELILSCSTLIKNALGAVGLLVLILMLLIPILKLLSIVFIYKGLAILIEPIGVDNVSDSLNEMGNTVMILISILILVAMMFLIMITILVNTGNAALIAR